MAHKFRNKLDYPLEVGHAYLIRLISKSPVSEAANVVMFYLGDQNGHPTFTPILDDDPEYGHEATLGHEIYESDSCEGSVTVIGRFALRDCDPGNLGKSTKQKVKPAADEDTMH